MHVVIPEKGKFIDHTEDLKEIPNKATPKTAKLQLVDANTNTMVSE